MISFNCIQDSGGSFDVLYSGDFKTDDKVMTRDDGILKFSTFDGNNPPRLVGGLVNHDKLEHSLGYKVFYSGVAGKNLTQGGGATFPVEDVGLNRGWNWIGHAPLISYNVNSGIEGVSGSFTTDDQIKTRAGNDVTFTTYDGSTFQGGLLELKPGVGYEVKVAKAFTFRYI